MVPWGDTGFWGCGGGGVQQKEFIGDRQCGASRYCSSDSVRIEKSLSTLEVLGS